MIKVGREQSFVTYFYSLRLLDDRKLYAFATSEINKNLTIGRHLRDISGFPILILVNMNSVMEKELN